MVLCLAEAGLARMVEILLPPSQLIIIDVSPPSPTFSTRPALSQPLNGREFTTFSGPALQHFNRVARSHEVSQHSAPQYQWNAESD